MYIKLKKKILLWVYCVVLWFLPNHNKHRKVLAEPEPLWSLHFRQSITADLDSKGNNSNGWISRKKIRPNLRLSAKLITQAWQVIHHVPHYQLGIQNKIRIKTASAFPSGISLFSLILQGFFIFCFLFVKICGLKICGVYVLNNNFQLYGAIKEKEDLLRANCTELHEP